MSGMVEVIGAVGTMAAAGGLAGYAVRGRSSQIFAPSIYRGDRKRAAVALTFDDGPSESTAALLDILDAHAVRATFFMCGSNVRRLPAVAQAVAQRGHEIGNHTDTHPRLDFKTPDFIYREIAAAQETIHSHTGFTPRFFRAPYGVRWFGLRRAQELLELTGVMWTVIGRDWNLAAEGIFQRLMQGVSNGGIVCLHDGRQTQAAPDIRAMLAAVDRAIPRLKERGLQFQTLSQMVGSRSGKSEAAG